MTRLNLRTHLVIIVAWWMSDRNWLITIQNSLSLVFAGLQVIGELCTVLAIDPCYAWVLQDQSGTSLQFPTSAASASAMISASAFPDAFCSTIFT